MSIRVPPQWIDGEMDVEVELQGLGLGVCVFDFRWNIVCPKFEEHFVVSIIKGAEEVFLEKSKLKKRLGWEEIKNSETMSSTNKCCRLYILCLYLPE